jgi:hypothetical protein
MRRADYLKLAFAVTQTLDDICFNVEKLLGMYFHKMP